MKKTICALLVTITLSSGVFAQETPQDQEFGYFITDINVNYLGVKNGFIAKQHAKDQETKYFIGIMHTDGSIYMKNPTDQPSKGFTKFKGPANRTPLAVGDWLDNKMLRMGYASALDIKIYPSKFKSRHFELPAMVTSDNYPLEEAVRTAEQEGEIFIYADNPKEGKVYMYKMIEPEGTVTREWVQKNYRSYGWETTYSDLAHYGIGVMKNGKFCTKDKFPRGSVRFYNGRTERKVSMMCIEFEKSFSQQAKDKYTVFKDLVKREISIIKEKYL